MNNFHTHTFRCKHAAGDVKDYAKEAFDQGAEILGMSDHTPLPDGRWQQVRMDINELDSYINAIFDAEKLFPKLQILKALECEWDSGFKGFYQEEILGKRNFDYLIGAEHWFPFHGEWMNLFELNRPAHLRAYANTLISTMETGIFSFIAHPDAFACGYEKWDKNTRSCSVDILTAAEEMEIPLEINGYGFRKDKIITKEGERIQYPRLPFWELASDYNITVICNSDAHEPEDVLASIEDCEKIAGKYNLTVADPSTFKTGIHITDRL